jgi:FMN phosphatase YigB (HAD superfamily)
MLIGFDLDNTLFKDEALTLASKELGYPFTQAFHTSWDLDELPKEVRDRAKALWKDPSYMGSMKVIPGTLESLRAMKAEGHTLVVVTARDHALEEVTRRMVKEAFGDLISEVYIVGLMTDKTVLLQTLGVALWVDDAPHQIQKTIAAGIPTILITNDNTKYNWHARSEPGVRCRRDIADIELELLPRQVFGCTCFKCTRPDTVMIICSTCGYKRCPHATHHIHDCTGRNDSGQVGSIYQ